MNNEWYSKFYLVCFDDRELVLTENRPMYLNIQCGSVLYICVSLLFDGLNPPVLAIVGVRHLFPKMPLLFSNLKCVLASEKKAGILRHSCSTLNKT